MDTVTLIRYAICSLLAVADDGLEGEPVAALASAATKAARRERPGCPISAKTSHRLVLRIARKVCPGGLDVIPDIGESTMKRTVHDACWHCLALFDTSYLGRLFLHPC